MSSTVSFRTRNGFLEQGNAPGNLHVPMVYEALPQEPVRWEYHVLTVDTREMDLPDVARLNELGTQGWLLVGVLKNDAQGRNSWGDQGRMTRDYVSNALEQEKPVSGSLVHYYFVRQKSE